MPRALVACSLLLVGGAAGAAATAAQQPEQKKGPLILPLTYKPRQYASAYSGGGGGGGGGFSTMSVSEGGAKRVSEFGACHLLSRAADSQTSTSHRPHKNRAGACSTRTSKSTWTRRASCRAPPSPSRPSRCVLIRTCVCIASSKLTQATHTHIHLSNTVPEPAPVGVLRLGRLPGRPIRGRADRHGAQRTHAPLVWMMLKVSVGRQPGPPRHAPTIRLINPMYTRNRARRGWASRSRRPPTGRTRSSSASTRTRRRCV